MNTNKLALLGAVLLNTMLIQFPIFVVEVSLVINSVSIIIASMGLYFSRRIKNNENRLFNKLSFLMFFGALIFWAIGGLFLAIDYYLQVVSPLAPIGVILILVANCAIMVSLFRIRHVEIPGLVSLIALGLGLSVFTAVYTVVLICYFTTSSFRHIVSIYNNKDDWLIGLEIFSIAISGFGIARAIYLFHSQKIQQHNAMVKEGEGQLSRRLANEQATPVKIMVPAAF